MRRDTTINLLLSSVNLPKPYRSRKCSKEPAECLNARPPFWWRSAFFEVYDCVLWKLNNEGIIFYNHKYAVHRWFIVLYLHLYRVYSNKVSFGTCSNSKIHFKYWMNWQNSAINKLWFYNLCFLFIFILKKNFKNKSNISDSISGTSFWWKFRGVVSYLHIS